MPKAFSLSALFVAFFSMATFASALTVSPAKVEVRGNPGQTLKGHIELFNEQNETKTFYTSFENFESRGDSGAPYFTGNKTGLATWLSSDEQVVLESGARVKIPYAIAIPSNAKPGGYFAAEFFSTSQPKGDGGGEVSIGGKIGVLILLRVNGEVEESAGLSAFKAKGFGHVVSSLPVTFEYIFNNTGGDRIVPKGEVVIKNTIRLTSDTLPANEKEGSVLPGSSRRFEVVWGSEPIIQNGKTKEEEKGFMAEVQKELKHFRLGWYTARLNVSWGETVQSTSVTYNFFVFPWHLLLVVFGVCVVVYILGKKFITRYNRYIIANAALKK